MGDTQLFIDGAWVDAQSGETFPTYAPSTGEKIADVAKAGREDAQRAVQAARKAFDDGPVAEDVGQGARREAARGRRHHQRPQRGDRRDRSARRRRHDQEGDVRRRARRGRRRSRRSPTARRTSPTSSSAARARSRPRRASCGASRIGVCSGIVPWNFPFLMAGWKIGPAIAAGNTVVLKPASFTSLSAIEMVKAVEEADIPPGVVNLITGPGGSAGEELAQHPLVDKVAFTGSTEVGRRIMQLASGTVKKVTLELGGKSANIVLDDADLDLAAAGVLWGTFFHNGQVCESGTRALVSRKIYDEFVGMLVERAGKIVIGDNMDMATDLGPLVVAEPGRHDRALREARARRGREAAVRRLQADRPRGRARPERVLPPDDLRGRQLDEDRAGGDLRAGVVRDPVRLRRRGDQDRERLDLRSRRRRVVEEPRAGALGRGRACAPAPCGSTTTT